MEEIYFNEKINEYTLKKEIKGIRSIKKIPIKYKENDSTHKYRKELLKKELEKC